VPAEKLDAAVEAAVEKLLAGGPVAQAACKRLVSRIATMSPEIDEFTAEMIGSLRTGAEGREGVSAFLEKRPAEWPETDSQGRSTAS
jgi:methylglutaconyl-CoA hydratase